MKFKRFDLSEDHSLRAWSAADEYLLQAIKEVEDPKKLVIYNDRFGYLAGHLHALTPVLVTTNHSQEMAITNNLQANELAPLTYANPMSGLTDKADQVLLKVPKALGLFELFLAHIAQNSNPTVEVSCAFMTRHFNASLVALAEQYFEKVEQSKAFKKSRLLKLSGLKKQNEIGLIKSIDYNGKEYKQYLGVFSANHIDYATQFFLDNVDLSSEPEIIMDLASGNGVMANEISKSVAVKEMHLVDDFLLAVESGKLNLTQENVHHHYASDLEGFESEKFDLIVTNPPFHFEHDINIQIPIALLKSSHRCLKDGGNLQIVSNKHLNYPVHLKSLFSSISVIAENDKFRVYQCTK